MEWLSNLGVHQKLLESLLKHGLLGPTPRILNSVGIGWSPRICIFVSFQVMLKLWELLFEGTTALLPPRDQGCILCLIQVGVIHISNYINNAFSNETCIQQSPNYGENPSLNTTSLGSRKKIGILAFKINWINSHIWNEDSRKVETALKSTSPLSWAVYQSAA